MYTESSLPLPHKKLSLLNINDLIVTRRGGGSLIDQRPLFSSDGEILYIVWKHVIRAYSTQTGDFVRELEAADHRIAGIAIHPHNFGTIIGCSDNGELNFWDSRSGIITKKLKLKIEGHQFKVKTFHIVNYETVKGYSTCEILLTFPSSKNDRIFVYLYDLKDGHCIKLTTVYAKSQEYYVDIIGNHGDNLIAILHDVNLHILNPSRNLYEKIHKISKPSRKSTCLAGHPEDECVATGDSSGRVVVWRSLYQTRPYSAVYHWHTLPVTEIAFSTSGSHMYTGGGECVLVKWILSNPNLKSFLPRLPAPIKHLTIAPDNLYVAVSTLDNGIVVVNPQKKLTSVIQNFTWGVTLSSKDGFPAGLVHDPRTNSLVLNSRTGHVQFYNTHTKSLMYNINITAQNFLTQQRSTIIVNTEVTKIALNHNGTWLATVEERDDKTSNIEVRLKFWVYDHKEQIFVLNTSIELPHENGVNALQFQPIATLEEDAPLLVTTGKDKQFKLWNISESSSTAKIRKNWYCYSMGNYRNFNATDAGFAADGSLLGVGFDSTLTIWLPETSSIKSTLTHSHYSHPIKKIEFGKHETCHLVVVGSHKHIAVWNLITLSIMWSVPLNVAILTADPKSTYMAAFSTDNKLYVFTPQSSTPVYTKHCVEERNSTILAACFAPHLQEKHDSSYKQWQQKSQLFFIDSNQELLTLEPESEVGISFETLSYNKNTPKTAFSKLLASKTTTSKESTTPLIHEHLGPLGRGMVDELLNVAAHTMPPMKILCSSFILSLFSQPLSKKQSVNDYSEDDQCKDDNESDDEQDKNSIRPMKQEHSPIDILDEDENSVEVNQHNWLFLSSIFPD